MIFTTSAASTAYVDKPRNRASGLIGLLAFAQMILASFAAGDLPAAERPNILWLTCEDMGPHLGCYGDDYSTTPTIDALAARGMRYTNASSNAPVCAPARTTIISGLYAPSTGSEHMRSETNLPAAFRMFPQYLREEGYYCTNNVKEDYNLAKPGQVWDVSNGKGHWKNRPEGQPFFAIFNSTTTHESQIRNEIDAADRKHDPAGVRIPAYHPDTSEVRRDWAQYYDRITMMDAEVARRLKELDEAGLAEDTIVFFFSDHGSGMPRNKRWLYGSGLDVPMIVYFPPKWRHLAPKEYRDGGTSDRLVSFVDLAPTVLSMAGIKPPSWMQGGAFAGEQQAAEPEFSYGYRARMDERYDLSRSVRDKQYRYIRNYMPHRPCGQHVSYMFSTPATRSWYKLFKDGKLNEAQAAFWRNKPTEELYDLEADPDEVNNLAESPEHASTLARLRAEHRRWEKEIADIDLLSEWEMQKRSEEASPYEIGHAPAKYDFDSVFAAAEMASSRKADDLPALVELLKHGDSGVRSWAATGLLAQETAGVKAGHDALVAALEDESPIVRITAAEALGRFGDDEDAAAALKLLLHYAGPESDYYLCVAAWNSLDFLDERARPALAEIRAVKTDRESVPRRMGEYAKQVKAQTLKDLK